MLSALVLERSVGRSGIEQLLKLFHTRTQFRERK
jgi:hypothetical protein